MNPRWRLTADADLRSRNTFGVAAHAPWLVEVGDSSALGEVLALPEFRGTAPLVLGGGSNLLFAGDPEVAVLALDTHRIEILEDDGSIAIVRVDAGVQWHALVLWTLQQGLMGLENLALIPGTTGAAPIQNIGAYGTEVGEFVHAVETWDRSAGAVTRLDRASCAFAYRDSLFKRVPDRYIVTAVEFALPRQRALKLDYAGIPEELQAMEVDSPTFRDVAEAVIRIRSRKLPDPAVIGNAGSFFKNPIVPVALAEELQRQHAGLPVFRGDAADNRKISAAWMIENCGWKGYRDGDVGVAASHALVLVNHGSATGRQLLSLARRIAESVHARFGVAIEPEPKIIGAIW
ncbi:UDP-N-acetylmuramate dehydrogenase [Pseudoxanthomonas sacheonensis]|uniref:UDP-N-acetylmuramate dehydrogenase n=1 Tax=Pseudoxanthomonas sacheonensis TaxID=443615 RepID=UPI0013D6DEDB|nr:UDP-N-acetylmuramate dehydrogenase [Pseudoxanthomonas sacheonensis]KAF1707952.1 UDP-N-acetylenolpyruvoylglucosamine reductase [Pseudoxanthomonas sacheonensis]